MADTYPVPTASPLDDIQQYVGLLLASIDEALDRDDVWPEADIESALGYVEDLKLWVSLLKQTYAARILTTESANLIACWNLSETSGTTAVNAQGTTARNGTYVNGVTLNASTFTDGKPAPSFDGSNDVVNVYSSSLNSAFNNGEITLMAWIQVSASTDWTDATLRRVVELEAGTTTFIRLAKAGTNTFEGRYMAGGVTKTASFVVTSTGWIHVAVTISKSADQLKFYLNGAQVSTTQTGLGTWSGSLDSTLCVIGGNNSSGGGNNWHGGIKYVALWSQALTAAEIADLASI